MSEARRDAVCALRRAPAMPARRDEVGLTFIKPAGAADRDTATKGNGWARGGLARPGLTTRT
jgi:hypothetical protein